MGTHSLTGIGRILFTFAGGRGHADPLVPLARAAARAGHDVLFSGRPSALGALAERGFATTPTGSDRGAGPPERIPLAPPDRAREEQVMREGFAGALAAERSDAVLALARAWRAEAVVCDETDFGASVVAELLGLPCATVVVIAAGRLARAEVVAEPVAALRERLGLAPEPAPDARPLVVVPFPIAFRDPELPPPAGAVAVRPTALDPGPHEPAPAWLARLGARRPAIAVTLGTVFNLESGDLLERVVDATASLAVDVAVTVGPQLDPALLAGRPGNVHVERVVALADLLPRVDVMVSHGGSGSVLGALAHGVPSVLLPMGADQPDNAERAVALGVARALDPVRVTALEIRDAVTATLADDAMRARARDWAEVCRRLPGPEVVIDRLLSRPGPAP
jgi:UDP:flavonoid glycosyltransferase YjiC (YdhE family)